MSFYILRKSEKNKECINIGTTSSHFTSLYSTSHWGNKKKIGTYIWGWYSLYLSLSPIHLVHFVSLNERKEGERLGGLFFLGYYYVTYLTIAISVS